MSKRQDQRRAQREADEVVLDGERRRGRVVAVAAAGSIAATIATVAVASAASGNSAIPRGPSALSDEKIDRAKHLLDFKEHFGALSVSVGLRCVGLLLMIVVGVYLYRIVQTRDENAVRPYLLKLTYLAPVLIAASTLVGFLAYHSVANDLASMNLMGKAAQDKAGMLIDDSAFLRITKITDWLVRAIAALWLALIATSAMKVGLLTRFLGYWGVAGGASLVLLPIGDAMVAAWIASMGILAIGYWPGGRPEAWNQTTPGEIEAI